MGVRASPGGWGRHGRRGSFGGRIPPSPFLATLKTLAIAAPTTVASIPRAAGVAPTIGTANTNPAIPGDAYNRYWISGLGKNNGGGGTDNPLLPTVSQCFNFSNWGFMYGDDTITINFNDGSRAQARAAYTGYGSSRPYIGITTNSRYLSVAVQAGSLIRLTVDGVNWPYAQALNNNCYINYDFGTAVSRNIVISGQGDGSCFFSDVCISNTATIAPYNFMAARGNTSMCFIGDSYLGYNDDVTSNISFTEMMMFMIGGAAATESGRGSTGYQRNAGDAGWAAVETQRRTFVNSQPARIVSGQLGINDSIPSDALGPAVTTLQAITTTLNSWRAAHPQAVLIIQGPWAPNQTNAQNPGGKYVTILNHIKATMQTLGGSWIFLDNIFGDWLTSAGTARGALRGAWQTGTGNVGAPTGVGNGDTWVQADGTHPTVPAGITGLSQIWAAEVKAALATM